jgi:hypothetical protein
MFLVVVSLGRRAADLLVALSANLSYEPYNPTATAVQSLKHERANG